MHPPKPRQSQQRRANRAAASAKSQMPLSRKARWILFWARMSARRNWSRCLKRIRRANPPGHVCGHPALLLRSRPRRQQNSQTRQILSYRHQNQSKTARRKPHLKRNLHPIPMRRASGAGGREPLANEQNGAGGRTISGTITSFCFAMLE